VSAVLTITDQTDRSQRKTCFGYGIACMIFTYTLCIDSSSSHYWIENCINLPGAICNIMLVCVTEVSVFCVNFLASRIQTNSHTLQPSCQFGPVAAPSQERHAKIPCQLQYRFPRNTLGRRDITKVQKDERLDPESEPWLFWISC